MWNKFKWDMFITSFLPLWFSIIVSDLWDCVVILTMHWSKEINFWDNLLKFIQASLLQLCSIVTVCIVVAISIHGINTFLKGREGSSNNPKGKAVKARKANKLSAEFLLAYILPMIAFNFGELKSVSLFVVYFFVLAFLCIRNNNIYTNIYLEFKGYKMYSCDIERNVIKQKVFCDSLVISKDDMTAFEGCQLHFWDFDNYIYIHVDEEKNA